MAEMEVFAVQHAEAILQWYLENGVDEALSSSPVDRLASRPEPLSAGIQVIPQTPPPNSVVMTGTPESKAEAIRLAAAATTLEELKEAIANFDGLPLKKTAMNLVFSSGHPSARVMVIGDAPETDDDRGGEAFSGQVGQLTDKMFAAIGLDRNSVYLTNVLNWRPPGNRSPSPAEIELSLPFLHRHIALAKPEYLFVMGGVASKTLLMTDEAMGKLRGKIHKVKIGDTDFSALVTYHPSFLLRSPSKKREAWSDLLLLKQQLLQ